MAPFTFTTTPSLVCEPGSLSQVAEHCSRLGIRRPLIVTDAGLTRLGFRERLEVILAESRLEPAAFDGVVADPPEQVIHAALAMAEDHDADGVIGFGGGSSLDTAKLVALLRCSGEALADIYGVGKARGKRLPVILIPTTAGTGSEVTPIAIVTTGETTKMGVVANQLYPDVAVLDAELTLGLPPAITAATGIDAMVHALEAYTSVHRKNHYSDMLAREALRLLAANVEVVCADGRNTEARQAMLLGSCLAGQAFANAPVAAVHALAYPLGGHYHLPHGLTNALVLPGVLRFNAVACAPLYAEIYSVIAGSSGARVTGRSDGAESLVAYFTDLKERLGIPAPLRKHGVPREDLPMLARDAMKQQRLLVNNPREVTEADALAIYEAAW